MTRRRDLERGFDSHRIHFSKDHHPHDGEEIYSDAHYLRSNTAQLIRIRSKDGNFRFDLAPEADIMELFSKVHPRGSCLYIYIYLRIFC
jgi:hypothetical protein